MRKFEADTWYEPIRLGKGTMKIDIESKSIVGDIVTACYNSQYGIQCETVHRRIVRSSSCGQDMHVSCLDGQYKSSITCQRRNSRVPSADAIRMLI